MRSQVPVVSDLLAVRIDEDVGDVLRIAHVLRPGPDFEERIVASGVSSARRRIELETETAELLLPPASRQLPVLALDVVHDDTPSPREKSWDHKPDSLARA